MAVGFKRDGKFIPTGQKMVSKTRKSRIRYANGAGMEQILEQSIKDFATKRKNAYNDYKANQEAKFEKEIALRRKFQSKLIKAYRFAKAQNVQSGRDLEKFIRAQIPDLPKEKNTAKFVVRVLRDFNEQEKRLEKAKKGKSEEEQTALQKAFEDSLRDSAIAFQEQQNDQDKKFNAEQKKIDDKNEKNRQKLEKENKEKADAIKKQKEAQEEARKKQTKEAEEKVEQAEKEVKKESQDVTTFAEDVTEELKKDKEEIKTEDFSFGFPEEIV